MIVLVQKQYLFFVAVVCVKDENTSARIVNAVKSSEIDFCIGIKILFTVNPTNDHVIWTYILNLMSIINAQNICR